VVIAYLFLYCSLLWYLKVKSNKIYTIHIKKVNSLNLHNTHQKSKHQTFFLYSEQQSN